MYIKRKKSIFGESNIPRLLFISTCLIAVAFFMVKNIPQKVAFKNFDYLSAVISTTLVDLANGDRAGSGLGGLNISPTLTSAAQAKANDMAQKSYFAHQSPNGETPWYWIQQAGYTYLYAGENLAVDFDESWNVNQAWQNSPTHRANIMYPGFTEVGIAVATGTYNGRPTTFVVQMFGTPLN
jgi:uncharacterized protein YkwD